MLQDYHPLNSTLNIGNVITIDSKNITSSIFMSHSITPKDYGDKFLIIDNRLSADDDYPISVLYDIDKKFIGTWSHLRYCVSDCKCFIILCKAKKS